MTTPDEAMLWARERQAQDDEADGYPVLAERTRKGLRDGRFVIVLAEAYRAGHAARDAEVAAYAERVAVLVEAAKAVMADWDARMRGDRERYVPPRDDNELDGYWSPNAAMVSSEIIAKLRAALEGHAS